MAREEQKTSCCSRLMIWEWMQNSPPNHNQKSTDSDDDIIDDECKTIDLHEDEIADFEAVFQTFDSNGNGEICRSELSELLKIFASSFYLSDSHLEQLVEDLDADKNGKIEFNDFLQLMAAIAPSIRRHTNEDQELKYAFDKIDADENGYITMNELKDLLVKTNHCLDDNEIDAIIEQFDEDKDGMLNYDEFKHMVSFSPGDESSKQVEP